MVPVSPNEGRASDSDEPLGRVERLAHVAGRDREEIHVLHVDDDPGLLDLASAFLERESDRFDVITETSAFAGLERLTEEDVDCVVSDYQMPGIDGIEFLEAVREDYPDLPFLLFTGKGSEEIAAKAISAGVTDYIQKGGGSDRYALLSNRIENAVIQSWAKRQVKRGFAALETAREGISLLNEDGYFVYVNEAYADIVSYGRDDLVGSHWEMLYPEDEVDRAHEEVLPEVPSEGRWSGISTYLTEEGKRIEVDHALSYTEEGTLICLIRKVGEPT